MFGIKKLIECLAGKTGLLKNKKRTLSAVYQIFDLVLEQTLRISTPGLLNPKLLYLVNSITTTYIQVLTVDPPRNHTTERLLLDTGRVIMVG